MVIRYFLLQPNSLDPKDFDLFRILDVIRLIRKIPAATPDESVAQLGRLIKSMYKEQVQRMSELVRLYPPPLCKGGAWGYFEATQVALW